MSTGNGSTETDPDHVAHLHVVSPDDVQERLRLHDAEALRARQKQDHTDAKYDALIRGFGTLTTTVADAVERLDTAAGEHAKRGFTTKQTWCLTVSVMLVAGVEVGARFGWW